MNMIEQNKPYDENKGVMTIDVFFIVCWIIEQEDTPLDDPIAEKERLKRISENADAKIIDEMFGGKADDGIQQNKQIKYSFHQ